MFEIIISFHIPNFFSIFNMIPNIRAESRCGVFGVRLNKNQLLFKEIMVQASMNMLDKINSLDEYICDHNLISYPELVFNF